jgi:hypothetical protein
VRGRIEGRPSSSNRSARVGRSPAMPDAKKRRPKVPSCSLVYERQRRRASPKPMRVAVRSASGRRLWNRPIGQQGTAGQRADQGCRACRSARSCLLWEAVRTARLPSRESVLWRLHTPLVKRTSRWVNLFVLSAHTLPLPAVRRFARKCAEIDPVESKRISVDVYRSLPCTNPSWPSSSQADASSIRPAMLGERRSGPGVARPDRLGPRQAPTSTATACQRLPDKPLAVRQRTVKISRQILTRQGRGADEVGSQRTLLRLCRQVFP